MIIALDAGHGLKYKLCWSGCRGNGLIEDKVVFDDDPDSLGMVQRVGHLIRKAGHSTVCTRPTDAFVSLSTRVATARKYYSDAFVSFHCNAAKSPQAHGLEIFAAVGDERGRKLAEAIEQRIVAKTGIYSRGVKWDNQGAHKSLYVLRNTYKMMHSVLIECGFLSNTEDAKLLASNTFRQKFAEAVAEVVLG